MRVEYANDALRRLFQDPGYLPPHLNADIAKVYRRKMQVVRAAAGAEDLHNLRSMRLRRTDSSQDGQVSFPLNKRFDVVLSFGADGEPLARILELVDNNLREVSR